MVLRSNRYATWSTTLQYHTLIHFASNTRKTRQQSVEIVRDGTLSEQAVFKLSHDRHIIQAVFRINHYKQSKQLHVWNVWNVCILGFAVVGSLVSSLQISPPVNLVNCRIHLITYNFNTLHINNFNTLHIIQTGFPDVVLELVGINLQILRLQSI